jgi:hypothetical protein
MWTDGNKNYNDALLMQKSNANALSTVQARNKICAELCALIKAWERQGASFVPSYNYAA